MAIEVTDEMRAAVHAETCQREGHSLSFNETLNTTETGRYIGGKEGKEPHIRCVRCDATWIVVDQPGAGYAEADTKFRDRLKPGDPKKNK